MAEVRGFRGIRYNEGRVGSYSDVVTPPYDVIDSSMHGALWNKSPYNLVRLILPEAQDGLTPYEAAARDYRAWREKGVLEQDAAPGGYLLKQEFQGLDGKTHTRRALFAVVRLPEADEPNVILGHERTFDHKVQDRLRLTEAVRANLGAVFLLYEDPEGVIRRLHKSMETRPEDLTAHTVDGVTQRLWRVDWPADMTAFFADKTLYIADGHHRFRMACLYRDQLRAAGHGAGAFDYALAGFVAFDDPGLVIWPTHRLLNLPEDVDAGRLLSSLTQWFEVTPARDRLQSQLDAETGCAFGLAVHGTGQYLARLRPVDRKQLLGDDHSEAWRNLDVAVLHRGVFERALGLPEGHEFAYEPDFRKAEEAVARGEKQVAFFLKGMDPRQVRECAEARDPMPQKATYFFPKLPSGAVIHELT